MKNINEYKHCRDIILNKKISLMNKKRVFWLFKYFNEAKTQEISDLSMLLKKHANYKASKNVLKGK